MTQVKTLITRALRSCGAFGRGMPPPDDAVNDALDELNWMIGVWKKKRWIVYRLTELSIACTGAEYYTMGPGGQLDISSRPEYLSYAFQRQLVSGPTNPVDYNLALIRAREDWAQIRLKKLTNFGRSVFYDPMIPLGRVYPWPVIPAPYVLFIGCMHQLDRYSAVTDDVNLPDEYFAAVYYNLVIRLGASYRIQSDPVYVGMAKDALNTIRQSNSAIKNLSISPVLTRAGGKYNIYSDDN